MDVITTAIIAALAALSKDAINDSYKALKSALMRKFGSKSDVADAVERLEQKPDSKGREATLQEEIVNARVNDDTEIVRLAQDLLDKLQEQPGEKQIIKQTQINTSSGNTVGGDYSFAPLQDGIKKT